MYFILERVLTILTLDILINVIININLCNINMQSFLINLKKTCKIILCLDKLGKKTLTIIKYMNDF